MFAFQEFPYYPECFSLMTKEFVLRLPQLAWKWKDIWSVSSMCKSWKTGHYATAAFTRCSPGIQCSGKNPSNWQGPVSVPFYRNHLSRWILWGLQSWRAKSTHSLLKKWIFITCHLGKIITHNLPFTAFAENTFNIESQSKAVHCFHWDV